MEIKTTLLYCNITGLPNKEVQDKITNTVRLELRLKNPLEMRSETQKTKLTTDVSEMKVLEKYTVKPFQIGKEVEILEKYAKRG